MKAEREPEPDPRIRPDVLISVCRVCGRRGLVGRTTRECACDHNHAGEAGEARYCRLAYCERVRARKVVVTKGWLAKRRADRAAARRAKAAA